MISVTEYLVEITRMCALGHILLYFDPIEMGRVPKNNRILHNIIIVIILLYPRWPTNIVFHDKHIIIIIDAHRTRFEILFVLVVFVQRV